MRRAAGWLAAVALVVVGGRGLWIGLSAPTESETRDRAVASLRFLSDDLGAHGDAMQAWFPEGRVFTVSLAGIAWAHVGLSDSVRAAEALDHARAAAALATDADSRESFGPAAGLPHGLFFHAWTTRLRAGSARLALATGRAVPADTTGLAADCRHLARALSGPDLFPDSYPGAGWPADAVVGAAALAECARTVAPKVQRDAERWLRRALEASDPETGLLPHAALRPDARGSSAALMTAFLAEVDPAVARRHYRRAAAAFPTRMLGVVPALREYPRGTDGPGDVDSGPLVLGASAPASVVFVAAAQTAGDAETAAALSASAEALGWPVQWDGRRRYAAGALPVGDAFLAWARTVPRAEPTAEAGPFGGWRRRWLLASAAALALGLGLGAQLWDRGEG